MIPAIVHQYLPVELKNSPGVETKATCHDCYKTKKTSPAPHFDKNLKCCTYYPHIPNFLVGALLNDPLNHPWFIHVFKKLVLAKEYVLPIGICAPALYQNLYNKKAWYDYGNREDLLCPFYIKEGGLCGVWQHRSHECATFYCVSDQGEKGEKYWQNMRDHLHMIELTIAQEAMVHMGYSDAELEDIISYIRIDPDLLEKNHTAQLTTLEWTKLWGHHMDNIFDYFKKCYEWANINQFYLETKIQDNFKNYLKL